MKRMITRAAAGGKALLACAMLTFPGSVAVADPVRYVIDPEHVSIGFLVDHIGYQKILGMFLKTEGEYIFDADTKTMQNLRVTVDADSVFTNHSARDRHVRGGDFLDVSDHPEIVYKAERAEVTGDRTGKVFGELTLLGQTHPLVLDVVWNKTADYPFGHELETMGVSARGVVKRSLYGMDYAVGNGLVGDDVELIIEMEANAK